MKQVFNHFTFFGVLGRIPWQQSTIVFIVDKIPKSVSRNRLMKNLFQEKKNYFNFFKFLSEVWFAISEKLPAWLSNVIYVSFQGFEGKHFFLKIEHDFNLLRTLRWKNGSFSQRVFSRVQTTKIRASREIFRWKTISLSEKFSFSVIIYGVWVISLSFCKVVQSGVSNYRSTCGKKKNGEINMENLFFQSILVFEEKKLGLSAKQ